MNPFLGLFMSPFLGPFLIAVASASAVEALGVFRSRRRARSAQADSAVSRGLRPSAATRRVVRDMGVSLGFFVLYPVELPARALDRERWWAGRDSNPQPELYER